MSYIEKVSITNSNDIQKSYNRLFEKSKKEPPFNPKEHKDKTRSKIALHFTRYFFGLIAIALVGIPIYNLWVQNCEDCIKNYLDIKETLLALSGIISAPFGFVVGYYFKGSEEN